MQIQIIRLQKPTDLDLHCLQNSVYQGSAGQGLKISSRNTIRVSNSLDSDQTQQFVGSDPGPNCLQSLSEADKRRYYGERVKGPFNTI